MNKHQFSFILVDGKIVVKSETLQIYKDGGLLKEIKEKGWILIIAILLIYRIQQSVFTNNFESTMDYVRFSLRLTVVIIIVALVFYYLLRYNWYNTIKINSVEAIEIEQNNNETELTIITSNKREKTIVFRTLENQVEPFIEALKRGNSRIVIKQI
ncbi:hypothetical protein EV195_10654 [Tenacibaculum skagerrakense]|uniref:Uncharacterized protein n=1 Tax=Tenacibaculum skagerrakense TaxID=186571 RepID=A0A4R2NRB4_9FLAO|nr:hypothetical protein [Tenacibaculum skagerrakense]TCP24252.1 hypothetical protein EV195_10654 [Tenacibaculum skagerrakense]